MSDSRRTAILTLNSGSSSLKFAVYRMGGRVGETRACSGSIDRIGLLGSRFLVQNEKGERSIDALIDCYDHDAAIETLLSHLATLLSGETPDAVGHRFVHGGNEYREPQFVSETLLETLKSLVRLAPDHLPHELKVIRAVQDRYPEVPQIACFDTAFHRQMPELAQRYPLPQSLWDAGIRRYGFHGLSYEYVLHELMAEHVGAATDGRLIIAHLGNGASMAAIRNGSPMDTTMGLTPSGGLMMGTRSGDLDPGVLVYLLREKGFGARTLDDLVNQHAGLRAVSGTSDMQELLARRRDDPRAAMAIALYCYQARKMLAAMAAALGGLDMLVFTAGIGANAAEIRWRIAEELEFLGIRLDADRNEANAAVISRDDGPVVVRVMRTDEERMMARHTYEVLRTGKSIGLSQTSEWTLPAASPVG